MEYEIRLADFADIRHFNNAINSCGGISFYKALFGQFNFSTTLETCVMSLITMYGDEKDTCTGFLALNDAINMNNDVDLQYALSIIRRHIPVKGTNTLFINFWMLDERQRKADAMGREMLIRAFDENPYVEFIVWICSKNVSSDFADRNFSVVEHLDSEEKFLKDMNILFVHRSQVLPSLTVRDARVEDTDDLIPILKASNANISDGQEANILADLIQGQDHSNHFYVGCNKNDIVGMLATSIDVNVSLIMKVYDIDPFLNLVIQKEEQTRPPPLTIGVVGDIRLIEANILSDICANLNCLFVNAEFLEATNDLPMAKSLELLIQNKVADATREGQFPIACVVYGFPRNEDDADAIIDTKYIFDIFLELQNISEDVDIDDNDDFCNAHVDGVEILRNRWFGDDNLEMDETPSKVHWQKLLIDNAVQSVSETIRSVQDELQSLVQARVRELERLDALYKEEPPKANAFAITSFCLTQSCVSRAEDLLRIAFEDHPDKDYSLYMVSCNTAPSRLLDFMTPVRLRQGISFDQALFVVHRDALFAVELLQITRLSEGHMSSVRDMLSLDTTGSTKRVLTLCENALHEVEVDLKDNPGEACFLARIGDEVVGIMNLSRKIVSLEDVNWLRANYDLDDLVAFERHRGRAQAAILQWLLSPSYYRWAKFMLREVMRQYGKTLLYFHEHPLISPPGQVLQEMIPVRPRRRIQDIPGRPEQPYTKRPSENAVQSDAYLLVASKRQLSQIRPTVLTRVVVVGGGVASMALLETLCFASKINVPHITLVMDSPPTALLGSTHRKTGTAVSSSAQKYLDDSCGCLSPSDVDMPSDQEVLAMGLSHRVTVVGGRLTDIDRANRAIVVSNEVVVEYDVLVIANSVQDSSSRRYPSTANLHPLVCGDRGVFGLGNTRADYQAIRWIKGANSSNNSSNSSSHGPRDSRIVVVGNALRAVNAVGRLMKFGIDASRISMVLKEDWNEVFQNEPQLCEYLSGCVLSSGVSVYPRRTVLDVTFSPSRIVDGVVLEEVSGGSTPANPTQDVDAAANSDSKGSNSETRLPCGTLLLASEPTCEMDTFTAVNDSGLIYDGGVVVDQDFRTIDRYVFSVGSFTKYSKIFRGYAPHSSCNAREMGALCALKVMEYFLDPMSPRVAFTRAGAEDRGGNGGNSINNNNMANERSIVRRTLASNSNSLNTNNTLNTNNNGSGVRPLQSLLHTFSMPKSMCIDVPGGFNLFESTVPGKTHPDNVSLVSGDMDSKQMCLLKLDPLGMTNRFVYIGNQYIEERNMSHIAGWHESYLNAAFFSFEQGLVDDWITFFRQDWALAIYFDKFAEFAQLLRSSLQTDKGMYTVLDRVFEIADSGSDDAFVASGRRKVIGDRCENLPETTVKSIETYTLDFLRKNRIQLNRFYVPQPSQSKEAK